MRIFSTGAPYDCAANSDVLRRNRLGVRIQFNSRTISLWQRLITISALVLVTAPPSIANPPFTDANWVSLGGYPGVNGQVNAVAADQNSGKVYFGGQFGIAGNVISPGVACWDGTNWLALGSGVNGYGSVYSLVADGAGNIYAGGTFTNVGGTAANFVAKWNGSSWSALGSGLGSNVSVLALDKTGNLYAGGLFKSAGGFGAAYIAKWDGGRWTRLGTGMNAPVYSIAFDPSGNLYAGGDFTNAGGMLTSCVAEWDGTNWTALGAGVSNGGYAASVRCLACDASGNVYAGGYFTAAGGGSAANIARWDGTNWFNLGKGLYGNGFPYSLAIGPAGELLAGGSFSMAGTLSALGVAKWDGTNWSALGGGAYTVYGLAADRSGNVFVGGNLYAGSIPSHGVAKWDGSTWSGLGARVASVSGSLNGSSVYALANDSLGNLYAGGTFTMASAAPANRIAKWNGTNWSPVGAGLPSFASSASLYYAYPQLALDGAGNLYGLGTLNTNTQISATNVVRWDGTNWSTVSTNPVGGPFFAQTQSVSPYSPKLPLAIAATRSGTVFVGGGFGAVDGVLAQNVTQWNGTNWASLGSGCEGPVTLLAPDTLGNIYAAGEFTYAGNVLANNIARWDGTNWSALGLGISFPTYVDTFTSAIEAIAADRFGNVYAGGTFTNAGNTYVNRIAKWDGNNWTALGSGIQGTVAALAADSAGNLYAGGTFRVAGGVAATNIAKWDGTNWSALGSGVNGGVSALSYDGNGHLYVAGGLTTAGTNVSWNVAEAIVGTATNPPALSITTNGIGEVSLGWPLDHVGWRLQSQRNPLGVGITSNWFTIPGSTNVNATNFPVRTGAGSVFYRLVYP